MKSSYFSLFAVLAAVLVMVPATTHAQSFDGGLFFTTGHPAGEFGDNVENVGLGGTLNAGYRFPLTPVLIGMEVSYLNYGTESRTEPWSYTIPDVTVDVNTSNNIFMWHALLRLQPSIGKIQPYVDGLVGFKYLFTKTSIETENDDFDDLASSTNIEDFVFSYGVGGGIKISVFKAGAVVKNIAEAFIDINFRYLLGSEAEYLRKGDIIRGGIGVPVVFDVQTSKTDMFFFNIGFSVKLN